jgi:hypothetical protein
VVSTVPDVELWPVPDPTMGDGSSFGESHDNDGRPGAVGGERTLHEVYLERGWDADTLMPPQRLSLARRVVDAAGYLVIASPFYSARGGKKARLGIFHTAEGARTREALGGWFQHAGANVSSHAGADDAGLARFVPDAYSAWAARSANPVAVQLEMCAFTAWPAAEWARHPGLLENAARWAADVHRDHGIPLVRVRDGETKTGTGFCMHVDITRGWKDGTHTDCGPTFPIDAVLARARELVAPAAPVVPKSSPDTTLEDPLSYLSEAEQRRLLGNTDQIIKQLGLNAEKGTWDQWPQLGHLSLVDAIASMRNTDPKSPLGAQLASIVAALSAQQATIGALTTLVQEHAGLSAAQVHDAVAQALAAGTVKVNVEVSGTTT